MNPLTAPPDPLSVLRQLDAEAIKSRLDQLDREREGLLVLLRAARRAENPQRSAHRSSRRKAVADAR